MDRVVDKSARFHLWIRGRSCVKEKRAAIFLSMIFFQALLK